MYNTKTNRGDTMEIISEPKKPEFFDLVEYVDRIRLSEAVLEHLQETSESFEQLLKKIKKFAGEDISNIIYLWLDNNRKELESSVAMEHQRFTFSNQDLLANDLFFDRLSISEQRIKDLHKFVCEHSRTGAKRPGEYRDYDTWVGLNVKNGQNIIYWWGAQPDDIKPFMKSYVEFYGKPSIKAVYENPFLKSALAHLLLVRLQPFEDGNSRTSRIVQNICFTSAINRVYGTKLKLSPLNISFNLNVNYLAYRKKLNDIAFSMEQDDNDAINKWLEFILNMYDEAMYYEENHLPALDDLRRQIESWGLVTDERVVNQIEKGEIKKLVH